MQIHSVRKMQNFYCNPSGAYSNHYNLKIRETDIDWVRVVGMESSLRTLLLIVPSIFVLEFCIAEFLTFSSLHTPCASVCPGCCSDVNSFLLLPALT